MLYLGWKIFKKTKIVRIICPSIQALTSYLQVPLSQLDFITVSQTLFLNSPTCFLTSEMHFYQGIPSLEETEETGILEQAKGLQKVRQFL